MADFLKRFSGGSSGDGGSGIPARERGKMRQRLRQQQRAREALLLDLGALVFELHRQGRREPELLQTKANEVSEVDSEVRALEAALAAARPASSPSGTAPSAPSDGDVEPAATAPTPEAAPASGTPAGEPAGKQASGGVGATARRIWERLNKPVGKG